MELLLQLLQGGQEAGSREDEGRANDQGVGMHFGEDKKSNLAASRSSVKYLWALPGFVISHEELSFVPRML